MLNEKMIMTGSNVV